MYAKGKRHGIYVAEVAGKSTAAQGFDWVVNAEIACDAGIGRRSLLTVCAVSQQSES